MDYALNHFDLLNVMLDIVYFSHNESEVGMGSFTVSSKLLSPPTGVVTGGKEDWNAYLFGDLRNVPWGSHIGLYVRPQAAESVGSTTATRQLRRGS